VAELIFWISSFIPQTVSGYTVKLGAGKYAGKTAIPLPKIARLWPGNTFKPSNAGYLTDQRTFSNLPSASARMRSLIKIETSSMTEVGQSHDSSGTTEVDLVSGAQLGYAVASMSRCKYGANPSYKSLGISRQLTAAAGDPLVGMAADIDYKGTLTVSFVGSGAAAKLLVAFEGMVDNFPAYESYATFKGTTKKLFDRLPPAGNTVADLLGGASNPVSGSVAF
jgi:hypothetical protein